jgi:hypothetical protein
MGLDVSVFGRPHNLKTLKHDVGIGVHGKALSSTQSAEIARMRGHPPLETAITTAGVPGKTLIDVTHRFDLDAHIADDASRLPGTV